MNKRTGIVLTSVLLAASLASAEAFAESRESPADTSSIAYKAARATPALSGGCLEAAAPVPRVIVASAAPFESAPPRVKRVYLDDYQRLNQPVTKPYSTQMIWLGQGNRPR